jgi:hypothetical protein
MEKKGAYGTVHVMEEEMREAGIGVFEARSGEAKRRVKKEAAPTNKARKAAPANKSKAK